MRTGSGRPLLPVCLLVVVLNGSLLHAQPETDRRWDIWADFIYRLVELGAPGESGNQVQIMALPSRAAWGKSSEFGAYDFCVFADSVPRLTDAYEPTNGSFYQQYLDFLTSLDIPAPDPEKRTELRRIEKQYNNQLLKLSKLQEVTDHEWAQFNQRQRETEPKAEWISYPLWYARSRFGDDRRKQLEILNSVRRELAAQVSGMDLETVKAIFEARDSSELAPIQGPTGLVRPCPTYHLDQPIDALLTSGKSASWMLEIDDCQCAISDSARKMFSANSFVTVRSKRGMPTDRPLSIQITSVTVELRAVGLLRIRPGPWFSQVVVKRFRNGPFRQDSYFAHSDESAINRIARPGKILVASGGRFSLKMTRGAYLRLKEVFADGLTISVGPYLFGQEGDTSERTKVTFDDSTNSVVVEDSSLSPVILGVVIEQL